MEIRRCYEFHEKLSVKYKKTDMFIGFIGVSVRCWTFWHQHSMAFHGIPQPDVYPSVASKALGLLTPPQPGPWQKEMPGGRSLWLGHNSAQRAVEMLVTLG
jgi:hypothetical protein